MSHIEQLVVNYQGHGGERAVADIGQLVFTILEMKRTPLMLQRLFAPK